MSLGEMKERRSYIFTTEASITHLSTITPYGAELRPYFTSSTLKATLIQILPFFKE
jgi:hypothetical protein